MTIKSRQVLGKFKPSPHVLVQGHQVLRLRQVLEEVGHRHRLAAAVGAVRHIDELVVVHEARVGAGEGLRGSRKPGSGSLIQSAEVLGSGVRYTVEGAADTM